MPALALRLAPLDPDLILVPSMTAKLSGYSRVFSCAKARAIELLCAVAATGVIGRAPGSTQNPTNVRSEEHTSELQSLMRISYAVFCLQKKKSMHHFNINFVLL